MIYKLILSILLLTHFISHAQQDVIFDKAIQTSGNLTIGQDLTQDSVAGMIRWDTVTMTFQGFNGSKWITFTSPSPSLGTDTLNVGDSYGGGIVFYIAGSHGLIVTDFDLGLPSSILSTQMNWGPTSTSTAAVSTTDGASNTALIVSALSISYNNGEYAAKICDNLIIGMFDDWYLPSLVEFETMSKAIGLGTGPPLTNLANLKAELYWTSTETTQQLTSVYNPNDDSNTVRGKNTFQYVRAIRAY